MSRLKAKSLLPPRAPKSAAAAAEPISATASSVVIPPPKPMPQPVIPAVKPIPATASSTVISPPKTRASELYQAGKERTNKRAANPKRQGLARQVLQKWGCPEDELEKYVPLLAGKLRQEDMNPENDPSVTMLRKIETYCALLRGKGVAVQAEELALLFLRRRQTQFFLTDGQKLFNNIDHAVAWLQEAGIEISHKEYFSRIINNPSTLGITAGRMTGRFGMALGLLEKDQLQYRSRKTDTADRRKTLILFLISTSKFISASEAKAELVEIAMHMGLLSGNSNSLRLSYKEIREMIEETTGISGIAEIPKIKDPKTEKEKWLFRLRILQHAGMLEILR